jgi:hypothetical protein
MPPVAVSVAMSHPPAKGPAIPMRATGRFAEDEALRSAGRPSLPPYDRFELSTESDDRRCCWLSAMFQLISARSAPNRAGQLWVGGRETGQKVFQSKKY